MRCWPSDTVSRTSCARPGSVTLRSAEPSSTLVGIVRLISFLIGLVLAFHDLRRTFASRLIQNGESLVYVKDQLGHHSIKVTVNVYGHLVRGANKAAMERLDEQAQALEAAIGQGETAQAQAEGPEIAQPDATPAQPAGH